MEPEVIDTGAALQNFLQSVPEGNGKCPDLFIDLEGTNLSRHGTVSLLTVLVEPHKTIHIVDITKLGKDAFNTADQNDRTLKSMLESENIVKVFFDIRNDSDALFSLYGVRVAGVEDLQLMELASRASSKRLVHGLAKCIEQDAKIGFDEQRRWREVKEKGRRLFAPECGGSYAVFDARPLPAEIKQYCAQDVSLMPNLREAYLEKLCDVWWLKIKEETAARITLSQTPSYDGEGRHSMSTLVTIFLVIYTDRATNFSGKRSSGVVGLLSNNGGETIANLVGGDASQSNIANSVVESRFIFRYTVFLPDNV